MCEGKNNSRSREAGRTVMIQRIWDVDKRASL